MQHHFTLKRDPPFCLDAFTPTMAALLFFVPVTLRENCREVTSSCFSFCTLLHPIPFFASVLHHTFQGGPPRDSTAV